MAVAYKSAGSGASTETSGAALSPTCPATVDANDILIAHVFWEGTTTTPSTPSGWDLLSGPHVIETTIARHWVYGRIAAGNEDGTSVAFGSPAVTTQRGARIYSFSGYVAGTILQICDGFAHTSNANDPTAPSVTTPKAGALPVLLVGQNDNNTFGSFTGETGGNWTEAVAEYTANLTPGLALGIQTCALTSDPGTVSGGTDNTTNDPAGVIAFYILDDPYTDKTASDSNAVGITDAYNAISSTVSASDSLSGFDDDWRLLTDSSTFTNHNRIDSAQVRLNGATAQIPDSATVSASDSLTAGLTDTFTGSQSFSVTDSCAVQASDSLTNSSSVSCTDTNVVQVSEASTVQNAFSATDSLSSGSTEGSPALSAVLTAADTCAVQASETVSTVSSSAVCSDTLVAGLTDTFTGSQSLSVQDGGAVQESDVVVILATATLADSNAVQLDGTAIVSQVTISAADSCSVQASESTNVIQNSLLSVTDSCAAQASEVGTPLTLVSVADSLTTGCSDLFTGSQAPAVQDSCTTQVSDAVSISSSMPVADSLAVQLSDSVTPSAVLSATDSCAAQSSESSQLQALISALESLAAQSSDVFTGSQALSVSDSVTTPLSEDQFSSLPTAASDGVATSLSDAPLVDLTFSTVDDLIAQLEEIGSKQDAESAIPYFASDSCSVQSEEGAVTELAGPYWTNVGEQEYGLVHADSYQLGRRENPSNMRW